MDFTAVVVSAVGLFILVLIYGLLRIGIRIGAGRAIKNIVEGFYVNVDEKSLLEVSTQANELTATIQKQNYWYNLFGDYSGTSIVKEGRTREVGNALFAMSYMMGQLFCKSVIAKKENELEVRMDRKALKDVAWLADYGFRVWIARNENEFRFGERLNKDLAEKMKNELETFERRIEIDRWAEEAEEEKEMRF